MKWRSLICEEHIGEEGKLEGYVSLGRVSFWIFLGYMTFFWFTTKVIPETLYYSWVSILLYNLAKKSFSIVTDRLAGQIKA